ncbi:MAG: hypothetical protein HXX08_00470 [Chloroflexi bacterium]|uniref:Uncharacterized protein n=1 Tax=Candidatus Chlorohelix allophototropha TaxID=3003348 RepID=A0A8T7LQR8_9CHLR|nr:hypothetical protein [Chloroflexota bacterium]WJW66222.1 hypothetical protein OZ401_002013 [Chloroflexota bacterium L227-S17]
MPLIIIGIYLVVVLVVWFLTRALSHNTAFGIRIFIIGLGAGLAGLLLKSNEDSLISASGAILSSVGILFILSSFVFFVRAFFAGEFDKK